MWRSQTSILPEHILFFGNKDNFWEMGDTGPCGPCSEIHMDMGPEACNKQGEPGHVCGVNGDCRRFIELWTLVFIQYNRQKDGTLQNLPARHVDTGMGFERVVKVLQGGESNYDTDLFQPIIRRTQEMLGDLAEPEGARRVSYRVIADHIRAIAFLIGDGVLPANDGRGYVLRLVIRRAARHGRMLGFTAPFLADLATTVIERMGTPYDELVRRKDFILATIRQEETRFSQTLATGLSLLDDLVAQVKARGESVIPGADAFRLYDTFGFPLDLTKDAIRDQGLTVDEPGYASALAEQRRRARAGAQFEAAETRDLQVYLDLLRDLKADGLLPAAGVASCAWEALSLETRLLALLRGNEMASLAEPGQKVELVLPETPFYVEAGGQVGDIGTISGVDPAGHAWRARIDEVKRVVPGLVIHIGEVISGQPTVGSRASATVDATRRYDVMRNHTATHLLHRELRRTLGEQVHQAGSVVAPDRLRFDFTYGQPVTAEQLAEIERAVNESALADLPVHADQMAYKDAVAGGAMALFSEKYGDWVRVVKIGQEGELSQELCGGTHLERTSQVGLFHIVSEESVGAGVRRIEAVTGHAAQQLAQERLGLLDRLSRLLHGPVEQLDRSLEALNADLQSAQREIARLRTELARQQTERLLTQVVQVEGVAVLAARVDGVAADTLREMSDWLRERLHSGVVVLATPVDDKPQMIAAVTEDLIGRGVHAGNLIRAVAKVVGGGGGGKPNLAQAGGKDLSRLSEALDQVPALVRQQLASSK
jgi:alanyl-tRNA synthetase